jgi:cell division transport system permease protein
MELVGAPLTFIRGPFIAEGFLQGGIGALLALGLLVIVYSLVLAWWGGDLRAVMDGGAVEFLPPRLLASLVVGGMAVGSAGGFAASRHAG